MIASIVRIALLIGLVFGVYKLYPSFKPTIAPILANPTILGAKILEPVVNKVNDLLPNNIQLPVAKRNPSEANAPEGQVDGAATSNNSSSTNSSNNPNLTNIIEQVKQKAGEAAQEQIDTVKKETGNAFCAVLIETIKKECGVQ